MDSTARGERLKNLGEKLAKALEEERLYELQNDAKLRAVGPLRVQTYDEFRSIVDGAHLRPLERKDKIRRQDMKAVWNPNAGCREPLFNYTSDVYQNPSDKKNNRSKDSLFELPPLDLSPKALAEGLWELSKTPRFGLHLMMLSEDDKMEIDKIFEILEGSTAAIGPEEIQQLKKIYLQNYK